MATTTNTNYSARSMNGIISYDDGAGGTMEGGTITANELVIDELQSKSPPNAVSLYTLSTGSINVGNASSTVNVSNLNVSNINVPLITFTVLNASTVNAQTTNSSTSNASTSNSSTSNSSTANNGTTNSSTSNSSTANNGTTNSSTVNVSTLNFGTTSGTTMNMSTINASVVNTNDVQPAASGTANLYTSIIGYNDIHIGNAVASDIYLESSVIAMREIIGQDYISATEFRSDFLNSATASAACGVYTDASVNQITIGRSAAICYMNSPLISNTSITTVTLNALTINASTSNIKTANASTANNVSINCSNIASVGGNITTLQASTLNSTNARLVNVKTKYIEPDPSEITNDVFLYTTTTSGLVSIGTGLTTGKINMGSPTSSINLATLNASTVNASNYNASNFGATNINASYIQTGELYSDYTELGNINVSSYTIDSLLPTATVDLFPSLTTGTLNIATNMTSTGAITMGNAASTGSFSLSEGTINLNPKTTLNIANQLGTGTANICNANTYRGTLNIAATANVSNASTNVLNIGSTTSITSINSWSLSLNTLASNIDIIKPLSPGYAVFSGTGTSSVDTIGYMFSFSSNTVNANMPTTGTYYSSAIYNSVPAGIYLLYWYNEILNNNAGSNCVITGTYMAAGSTASNRNIFNQQCGISNMTLGFNRVFGYQITYPISIPSAQAIHLSVMMNYVGGTLRNNGTTSASCYMLRVG